MKQNTTANESKKAIDPGGTRPTQNSEHAAKDARNMPEQKVESGDRNSMPNKPSGNEADADHPGPSHPTLPPRWCKA